MSLESKTHLKTLTLIGYSIFAWNLWSSNRNKNRNLITLKENTFKLNTKVIKRKLFWILPAPLKCKDDISLITVYHHLVQAIRLMRHQPSQVILLPFTPLLYSVFELQVSREDRSWSVILNCTRMMIYVTTSLNIWNNIKYKIKSKLVYTTFQEAVVILLKNQSIDLKN